MALMHKKTQKYKKYLSLRYVSVDKHTKRIMYCEFKQHLNLG